MDKRREGWEAGGRRVRQGVAGFVAYSFRPLSHTQPPLPGTHSVCAALGLFHPHSPQIQTPMRVAPVLSIMRCGGAQDNTHTRGGLTRILTPGWYNFEVKFLPIWSTCGASTRMERGAPKPKQQRERTQKSCVAKRKAKGGGCGRLARERREAFEQQNTRTRSNGLASTKPFPAFVSHGVVGVRDGRTTPQRELVYRVPAPHSTC